ncbi:ArgP/LysG family DNA-binding transcriptional regulator [Paraglaciecola mesophila]|uniref:ArgP/LysG family DNA-binding transcriptional regulator n=1 Tax=Paraglaciecola mesophila TaxID=197222 RepID=A0ABU9SRB3_9ALTE|tara:strand:- start:3224 stop:4111 length:888 start_codon:yes stop_codon:yes gene_type:complete
MLDYDALHCLSEVLRYGSFDKGAQALHLTQSAVSQKIKRLELQVGSPVLVRTKPLKPTPLGQQLLAHVQRVNVLEEQLSVRTGISDEASPLSIAINNDVLATWFSDVMSRFSFRCANPVHIFNADQTQTRTLLQQGKVMGCISQTGTPIAGGESVRLGNMDYQLYASPEYIARYLAKGISPETVTASPGLLYDEFDVALLTEYQRECLGVTPRLKRCHWYPSSYGFLQMAVAGVAWALLPALQVKEEVRSGKLLPLFPDKYLGVTLFWHWVELESDALGELSQCVKDVAKEQLIY